MIWIMLCGLLFSSTLKAQSTSQLQESADYLPGAFLCKLKQSTALHQSVQGLDYEEREQILLDRFHLKDQEYGAVTIEPAFKLIEKEHPQLATVYKISFANTVLTQELLNYLLAFNELEYVERVPERKMLQTTPNDPQYSSQWYLDHIKTPDALWRAQFCNAGLDMSGVTIAIVDDAIYTAHEDLTASIWTNPDETINSLDDDQNGFVDDVNGWDLGDNDNNVNPPTSGACDVQNGHFDHGTHVAGIAAAVTNNSIGISSLGGGASILPVKCGRDNFSPHCGGAIFNGYQGIEYAIYAGADVINCSWGGKVYSYTEELIVNTAHTAGIVVVAAAGNEGLESIYYPAAYTKSIAVGATDANDEIASFSNYGSQIDVMAPGVNILSCLPTSTSAYGSKNGTSMATPVVSGLVALMLGVDPSLEPEDVRDILKSSAEDIYSLNDPIYAAKMGAGRINAEEAVKSCCLASNHLTFQVSSNFQTVCPTQWVHFIAVEQRNRTITATNVTNISWLFPGSAAANNTNTLAPSAAYAVEGVYDVTFSYTDRYGDPQSVVLEDYITVRNNVSGFSSKVDNNMHFKSNGYLKLANNAAVAQNNGHVPLDMFDNEGVASVSNIDGNLLFYNISGEVYNRFNEVMPNGSGLYGESTTQTLIVPAPGTCKSKFYLFTTGSANSTGLFYSVIDMSLDDGKGDVIDKETPIAPGVVVNEKMTAVPHCNGTDLWVLFQEANTNDIWTLRINTNTHLSPTSTGIMTPSVSVTTSTADHAGVMKASPAGDKIAVATNGSNVVEVYNFNRSNGWMSPFCSRTFSHKTYSCEFSPDGNLLYVAGAEGSVDQMDLTSSSCTNTIVNLSNPVDELSALELAPNGQIYFSHAGLWAPIGFDPDQRRFIGTIKSPNQTGAACDISLEELEMDNVIFKGSLNNGVISRFVNYQREYALSLPEYISACAGETVTIASNYQGPTPTYQWCYENGTAISGETSPSMDVTVAGTYLLKATDAGGCEISAKVVVAFETISQLFPESFEIECGSSIVLDAGPGFASYLWSTGETSQSITVSAPGTVYVEVKSSSGCTSTQAIAILPNCCEVEGTTDPFEKEYYSAQFNIKTEAVIKDPSSTSNYIIAGTSYEVPLANDGSGFEELNITLISVDDKGELNWNRNYSVPDLGLSSHLPWGDQLSFRVTDMRPGPSSFILTGVGLEDVGIGIPVELFSFVGVFDYSGNKLSAEVVKSGSKEILLNSIDAGLNSIGLTDGYLMTGLVHTPSPSAPQELVFGKFDFFGQLQWDQTVTFTNSNYHWINGVESCPNVAIGTGVFNGYVVSGLCSYLSAGVWDHGLALCTTDPMGNVVNMIRIPGIYTLGASYKLIETTHSSSAGVERAFLLLFDDGVSNVYLMKFDALLNVIWSNSYSALPSSGVNLSHGFDLIEESGAYTILASGSTSSDKAMVFQVDYYGALLSGLSSISAMDFGNHSANYLGFTVGNFDDRLIKVGNEYVSAANGPNEGMSFIRWDMNFATTCSDEVPIDQSPFSPIISIIPSTDYSQQPASLTSDDIVLEELNFCLEQYCCNEEVFNSLSDGCYFTFDFDVDIPCGLGELQINNLEVFGDLCPFADYSWTIDGVEVSTSASPTLTNVSDGSHELCLTISNGASCSKTVCKTVWVGPELLTETLEACNGSVWYQPENCSTYYSYQMIDHDPSDDMWHDYNYNSLTDPTYGGPGCAGWIAHNLIVGHYTILLQDDMGCTEAILQIFVVPNDTLVEYDTIKACGSTWYMPDSCGKYESYRMVDHDPSDDQWHNYNYNSLTDPTYGGPGCTGWIAHNLIVGEYTIYFDDANGCTQKVLHLAVMPDTVFKTKDIYVCPGECKTIDISDPDYFCQPNTGYFYGFIDDGVQVSQLLLTTDILICYPMSGTFEFITTQANGCVCVVKGNIIAYSPCPEPSVPGQQTSVAPTVAPEVLDVYPNPTNGLLLVNYQGIIQPGAQLLLIDLLGKTQMEMKLSERNAFDLTALSSGTYMLIVRNGSSITRRKIVKE